MMRRSGSAGIRWGLFWLSVAVLGGCARPVVVSEEPSVSASSPVDIHGQGALPDAPAPPAAASSGASDRLGLREIREIKVIDDNGQQGVFVKLSGAPKAVTHYTVSQPNRLVIDVDGAGTGRETVARRMPVDNPAVSEIRVAEHEGKLRLSIGLRLATIPPYTVSDLNDTVVAFIGEPTGGTQPVREQVVFTHRAVERGRTEGKPAPSPETRVTSAGSRTLDPAGAPHPAYHGQRVSLDFKDADVHNVLRLLAEVSKLNIVATDDVRGKVTLRLFEVPWDQALDIILQVLNLESVQENNVIRISTVKRLREEREELQRAQEAAKAVEPLRVEYLRVNYTKATKMAEIISGGARASSAATGRSAESQQGVLSTRGSVFVDEFTNTLVVRDIQRGIENARELVRRLDVQTPQVLIESNIVEATTDFARDMGVQWGYRAVIGPETGTSTGVNFPGTIAAGGGGGLNVGAGAVPFMFDFPAAIDTKSGGSALGLLLGSTDGSQALAMRLTALEKNGKARVISRPRVATLNNVPATIKSLTILRVKLPSTGTVINTGAGGAAGSASTATEKIETGIILVVTPQVSADGFVLLDIFAKSSQADFTLTVDQIPTEISREANSHVLVKDGQTVVLGGIYRDNLSDAVNGTPFLKDIPGIGWMFREDSKKDRREDLLVFLTPRILGGGAQDLPSAAELWKNRDTGRP